MPKWACPATVPGGAVDLYKLPPRFRSLMVDYVEATSDAKK